MSRILRFGILGLVFALPLAVPQSSQAARSGHHHGYYAGVYRPYGYNWNWSYYPYGYGWNQSYYQPYGYYGHAWYGGHYWHGHHHGHHHWR